MSLASLTVDLAAQLATFKTKILALFAQPVEIVNQADNATALNGNTPAQIKAPFTATMNAHLTANNPHGLTAANMDSLSTEVINSLFSVKATQGQFPITGITVNGNITITGTKITVPTGSVVFISGIGNLLKAPAQFNVPAVITSGLTYYLYLELSAGAWRLAYYPDKIPESESFMYITQNNLNNIANYTVPNTNNISLRRLDAYRISPTNVGSAFIATKSNPTAPVSNIWS